jgi:putative membrane protein
MSRVANTALLVVAAVTLGVVVAPRLDRIAQQLFAAHMIQHLLLIAVVAPLVAFSSVGSMLAKRIHPVAAWILFVGLFLFWHWPAAFRWAAQGEITRLLELGSILSAATLFWSVALPRRSVLSAGSAALYVLTAALATDLPGVIMIFAPQPICTMPLENAGLWNLSPLQDQQIAGLLMWVPANLVFFSFAIGLIARWMSTTPQKLVTS